MNFDDPDSATNLDEVLNNMTVDAGDDDDQHSLDEMFKVQKKNASKIPELRERLFLHAKEAAKFGTIWLDGLKMDEWRRMPLFVI